MADQNPSPEHGSTIEAEFVEFGRNIKKALQSAWASEDRKKLQTEIETGLNEASKALKQVKEDFSRSQATQPLKTEAEDFQKRVQSGELETKVRSEVLAALRMANAQLKKAFSGGVSADQHSEQPPAGPEES